MNSQKISICNLKIEDVDHFNFLRLIIDKNMKWNTHVQKVANKIGNTSLIENHTLIIVYFYGATNYEKILKLQKQAIRTISLNHYKAHTSPLFKSMNLLDIRDINQLQLLKLYYKVKNSLVTSYFQISLYIYNRNNVHSSKYSLQNPSYSPTSQKSTQLPTIQQRSPF